LSIQNHSKNWIVKIFANHLGIWIYFLSLMGKRFNLPHSTLMQWQGLGWGNLEGLPGPLD